MKNNGSSICIVLALLLFAFSLIISTSASNSDHAAQRLGRRLEKRIRILDSYMSEALSSPNGQWLVLDDLPEDMVVYKYVYDTLQSWCNQFPIINDDISSRMIYQRLSSLRPSISSPLGRIGYVPQYINLGPKWYIVRSMSDGAGSKVIGGIEINDLLLENISKAENGVNRNLKLPGKFHVQPISYGGGSPVRLNGQYLFTIISDTSQSPPYMANSVMRWLALLCAMLASFLYLLEHRSLRVFAANSVALFGMTAIAYVWGVQMQETSALFSPVIYADGQFLYSFGTLMMINLALFLFFTCMFFVRDLFLKKVMQSGKDSSYIIYGAILSSLIVGIVAYSYVTLHSLIMNSNISLELHMWHRISVYTLMVYISYTGLMIDLLLLGQMLMPVIYRFWGRRYNLFTNRFILIFALVCAGYFSAVSGILGLKKEHNRIMVISSRLAADRDLGLELQLINMEENIANDPYISALTEIDQSGNMIVNRLTENYMTKISMTYDIIVSTCNANDANCHRKFDDTISRGTPIGKNSRFVYIYDVGGRSGYAGLFIYYSPHVGVSRVLIELYPKSYSEENGYYSILGKYAPAGKNEMPNFYSYAKYADGFLVNYKGDYPYPTVITRPIRKNDKGIYRINGFIHFANQISDNEIIVISRQIKTPMAIFVTFSYLFIILYIIIYTISSKKPVHPKLFKRNYFRSSINLVLSLSIFSALIIMTILSITFVFKRNDMNTKKMMTSKINAIQTMFAPEYRKAESWYDLNTPEVGNALKYIGTSTESDITLYTPEGKVFKSTTPDVFERQIIGSRINQDAYYNIRYRDHRFYIHSEMMENSVFSAIYAPIFNDHNKMVAIICTPYNEHNYDFRLDAMFHAATIINLVLILLAITLLFSTTVVNAMFRPLIEIGNKMSSTNIHELRYIIYKRDDEISTIVDAYNRMVHDLYESTRQLTQVERDKAWSEMARQVAHEIKNPLTPIKLEIQRLIRLKQKNDPSWETKFDNVASIILEHIDILTDTANEFSTFAKLYSEEPVVMDLDRTLRDQLSIFDNKDNIRMEYIGLNGATVLAPRPQLIRVFVNLITNAIQAIEQREGTDGPAEGRINIYLRNSTKDGFYDVVFEDNGPGVSDSNLGKLFTPNFTTKSGGTGLGLAICRNIVEKCDGEITYQRSPILKGACFTVRLPKNRTSSQS